MTRSFISTLLASVAFAAADAGAGAGAKAAEAPESATPVNVQILPLTDEKQIEALKEAFGDQRKAFPDFESAYAELTKISEADSTKDLFGLPVAIVGYDSAKDEVDTTVYDGADAVLALVGARGIKGADGKERNSFKAVVIFPIPRLATFLGADDATVEAIPESQRNWLNKIVVKEASHVAFRNFRDANTLNELMNGAKAAPKSVEEYVTASNREGSGLDTDTFDALWSAFRTMLRKEQPAIFSLLPAKAEVIKAIRSKSYAESQDDTKALEEHGIFTKIAQMLIAGAAQNKDKDGKAAPLDPSAIQEWLDGRDTLNLTKETPAAKDFSVLATLDW